MRHWFVEPGWAWGPRLFSLVLLACSLSGLGAVSGCAVSESDVHRWETTEGGPEKLYAIVTHDKYSWPLREEAALSLVRMRPRNGKRVGLEYLAMGFDTSLGRVQGALGVLTEEARRTIVDGITPKLVEAIVQPPPPKPAEGAVIAPDPSVPYKDAAFALLSHEPPLATDDKAKAELTSALAQWVQSDFETRIDNGSQQFGIEQIMRFIGSSSVKSLPTCITESSTKVDRACALVADIGDEETNKRAAEAVVVLVKRIDSPEWLDKTRAAVLDANRVQHQTANPQQVAQQLTLYQEQELEKVFTQLKRIGGRPAVDYCLAFAHDKSKSEKMRVDALLAIENRVDKNVPNDVNLIFDIVKDDTNPDKVRGVALARLGELPKEMILPQLYSLFDRKWQGRMDAERMIVRMITTKELADFMRHLPDTAQTKIGMSEPLSTGATVMAMDPQGGPKPRTVLNGFLESKELGAKLTAVGSYYQAKKGEASALTPLESDKSPVPKCDPADQCGWTCDVAKPGSKDTETKTVTTVGEFVKWCVEPSLQ